MTSQETSPKAWNIALWVAQVLLAGMFIMAGSLKTFSPISNLVAQGMDYGLVLTRFIGITELLGAVGLILPALLRIKPVLTIWAAVGIVVIMVLAVGYHISKNEFAHSGMPALLGLMAVFVAWGRSKKASILAKM